MISQKSGLRAPQVDNALFPLLLTSSHTKSAAICRQMLVFPCHYRKNAINSIKLSLLRQLTDTLKIIQTMMHHRLGNF